MIRMMKRMPKGVSRDELAINVCEMLELVPLCGLKKLPSVGRGDFSRKAGLYVIYDADQKSVLYIGQVKDRKGSSVISRIRKHMKNFSDLIDANCYYRFCQFENLDPWQLCVAERLAILKLRPELNDGIPSQKKLNKYEWVL